MAVVLKYGIKGAQSNQDEMRDFVSSADTVLEHLLTLIEDAHAPIHETLVLAATPELRAPVVKGAR